MNKEFLNEITSTFPDKLFSSKIRRDISVSRAVLEGRPVLETEPNSRVATDYKLLAKEFLKKLEEGSLNSKLKKLLKNEKKVGI